jgi:hypothetical protein
MLAIALAQEGTSSTGITWLVWVVLGIFLLMVVLGRWASGRLPAEDETVLMDEGGHGEGDPEHVAMNHEEH